MTKKNLPAEIRFADVDGYVAVEKVIRLDLDQVDLYQDLDGFLTAVEKPQPAKVPESVSKFRTEREGTMFRVIANRSFFTMAGRIMAGERGGLMAREMSLSQDGDCWIGANVTLGLGATVFGDASISGACNISGYAVSIYGNADLADVNIDGPGTVTIGGYAKLRDVVIRVGAGAQVSIGGTAVMQETSITPTHGKFIRTDGCCIENADLRAMHDLVSFHTVQYGWLDAFRDGGGDQVFSIGCQTRGDADSMRELAGDYGHRKGTFELGLLEGFLQMAAAARAAWPDQPQPAATAAQETDDDDEDDDIVASAPATAAGFPVSTASVFSEAAAAAREAATRLRSAY